MKEYSEEEILYKICAYCSLAERCEKDIRNKLISWGIMETELQTEILNFLQKENYLSPSRYCQAYVNDKFRYQGWGKIKIKTMLQANGLPKFEIEQALSNIDEDEYRQIATNILQRKSKQLSKETPYLKEQKLLRYALSRGFSYTEISDILSSLNILKADE